MNVSKNVTKRVQEKMNIIASSFGARTGTKVWRRCTGKWSGTVDYSILFDNGESLCVYNSRGASKGYFEKCLDNLISKYSPEAIRKTKEISLANFRQVADTDNAKAAELGLLPYEVLSIELNNAGGYMGWFYTRLRVGDRVINHLETGAKYSIMGHKIPEVSENYFVAGGLSDDEVDYVFHGVGHSSTSRLYKVQNNNGQVA